MKVVILAGGLGTRLSEETGYRPKPMVEIGGRPILWHIMKLYSHHGFKDFIICCGYKGYIIKEYFANYFLHMSDVTFDMVANKMITHQSHSEPWVVTLVNTGDGTMTGGRIRRVQSYVGNEPFHLTYGDGVADVDLTKLTEFHRNHQKKVTVTAVQPPGRFGSLAIGGDKQVKSFLEKPQGEGGYINGGFFVVDPSVFELLEDDKTVWEQKPLETLSKQRQLMAFHHDGFWLPMDTLRDKNRLEELWVTNNAPWKVW